jgi:hypothetical protein
MHYASRMRLWLDIVVLIASGVAGIHLWQSSNTRWLGIAALSVSGIFALILLTAFVVIPPLAFRREPKFRDEYSLTFSDQGVRFNTEHIHSTLEWSIYSKAVVDRHSYVLYYGPSSFTVIPQRVFQNGEQRTAFDELLVRHVREIVTKA